MIYKFFYIVNKQLHILIGLYNSKKKKKNLHTQVQNMLSIICC